MSRWRYKSGHFNGYGFLCYKDGLSRYAATKREARLFCQQQEKIDRLEDAIDLVIEELAASGQGKEKVGGETLIQFMCRTLNGK